MKLIKVKNNHKVYDAGDEIFKVFKSNMTRQKAIRWWNMAEAAEPGYVLDIKYGEGTVIVISKKIKGRRLDPTNRDEMLRAYDFCMRKFIGSDYFHGDLSASNIFIDEFGYFHLIDWDCIAYGVSDSFKRISIKYFFGRWLNEFEHVEVQPKSNKFLVMK